MILQKEIQYIPHKCKAKFCMMGWTIKLGCHSKQAQNDTFLF